MPDRNARRKLFGLQALNERRSHCCVMFIYNILSGQVACPDIVYLYNPPRELKRNRIFDDIFHRTN